MVCICMYTCVCLCVCFCMYVCVCTTAFIQIKGQLHGTRSFLYTGPRDQSPAVRYSGNCLSLLILPAPCPHRVPGVYMSVWGWAPPRVW